MLLFLWNLCVDTPLHIIQQGEGDDLTLVIKSPGERSQNLHIYGSSGPKDRECSGVMLLLWTMGRVFLPKMLAATRTYFYGRT